MRRATPKGYHWQNHRHFLSTLSLRRATRYKQHRLQCNFNFYPRSPCGERQQLIDKRCELDRFLSTLSLRRATAPWFAWLASCAYFYPRSPCGERLSLLRFRFFGFVISIHALLAESDPEKSESLTTYFISIHALLAESDRTPTIEVTEICISIHALLAESDPKRGEIDANSQQFLSTLSLRRATTYLSILF